MDQRKLVIAVMIYVFNDPSNWVIVTGYDTGEIVVKDWFRAGYDTDEIVVKDWFR